jgi:hypothetical protein
MNFLKYDYYGNYDNNIDKYNFSVSEIQKNQKEREKRRMEIYQKILIRCLERIKASSIQEDTFCFFEMPEFIPGMPLYNMTECLLYILNTLKEKGFSARYVDPYMIYISWNLPKPNYKMIEAPKVEEDIKPINQTISNLKYRPIENYKSDNNFLFKGLVNRNKE